MKDYHINIFYSDEDGCYIADIPDLETCSAFGDTPEEALREIQIAKDGWLEVAREYGYPIPEPRYKAPVVPVSASTRTRRRSGTGAARSKTRRPSKAAA